MQKSKCLYILSAVVGVSLTLGLMLLPSIVLGVPHLALIDHRLQIFLVIISVWVILEARGSTQIINPDVQTQAKWLPYVMGVSLLLLFMLSLTERALTGITPFSIMPILGGIMMSLGILLRYLAIRELGDYFLDDVAIIAGQLLVTTGIYSHLRHPSEAGNLCIAFGCSLLLGSQIGVLLCIFLVLPIVLKRIQLEDPLLMSHFPEQFRDYSRNVPALIPWGF